MHFTRLFFCSENRMDEFIKTFKTAVNLMYGSFKTDQGLHEHSK